MPSDFLNRVYEHDKKSALEVLLSSIKVEKDGTTVYPTNCPGRGRKPDILTDDEGNATCMFRGNKCPYLIGADFKLEDYTKSIDCNVGSL